MLISRYYRNDKITVDELDALQPDAIILSPGPGKPSDAGICDGGRQEAVYRNIRSLGYVWGIRQSVKPLAQQLLMRNKLMHGKTSEIQISPESRILKGLKEPVTVARYHSLAVREETLPKELSIAAKAEDGEIMAVEHVKYPLFGLQFHPESIMTPQGGEMIRNLLQYSKKNSK